MYIYIYIYIHTCNMYIYRAFLLGGMGESPATSSKIAHSLPPGKILQVDSLPDQVFILPPPKISFPIPSSSPH